MKTGLKGIPEGRKGIGVSPTFHSASTFERFANLKVVWAKEQEIAANKPGNLSSAFSSLAVNEETKRRCQSSQGGQIGSLRSQRKRSQVEMNEHFFPLFPP